MNRYLARRVVETVTTQGGRFLRNTPSQGGCRQLSDKEAIVKVSEVFRQYQLPDGDGVRVVEREGDVPSARRLKRPDDMEIETTTVVGTEIQQADGEHKRAVLLPDKRAQ